MSSYGTYLSRRGEPASHRQDRGTALLVVIADAISPNATAGTLCVHTIEEPRHSLVTTACPQTSPRDRDAQQGTTQNRRQAINSP